MTGLRLSWLVHFVGDAFVANSLALTRDELGRVCQFDETIADLEGTRPAAGTVLADLADRLRTRDDVPLSMRLWEAAEGLTQSDADHICDTSPPRLACGGASLRTSSVTRTPSRWRARASR